MRGVKLVSRVVLLNDACGKVDCYHAKVEVQIKLAFIIVLVSKMLFKTLNDFFKYRTLCTVAV